MAITANGYIASNEDETLRSDEEWRSYQNMVKKAGNMIIGRRTYELTNDFSNFDNAKVVVVTSNTSKYKNPRVVFCQTFLDAVNFIKQKGFKEILVAGGGKLNKTALDSGLIDEIYLDIEPFIFGEGIALFALTNKQLKLKLMETKKLSENTIQLHYKVIK